MARPKNIALQEQVLAEAQKKLEQIEKMRAEMVRQVELEIKRLNEMRELPEDFTQSSGTRPPLGSATPSEFKSQFEEFGNGGSPDKLKSIGNGSLLDFAGKLVAPNENNVSFYRTSDRDEHWTSLTTDPGKAAYVSGYYYSSGRNTKHYEYKLESRNLPIQVGDMVMAPVHYKGHNDGQFPMGHDRRFIITDIYSKPKFHRYPHDTLR